MRPLTALQLMVLGVVADCGPVTAADVSYHLRIDTDSARGVLGRLENRRLIEARYTGHHRGRGRAYVTSDRTTA